MNYLESTLDYILDADHWTGAMGLGTPMIAETPTPSRE